MIQKHEGYAHEAAKQGAQFMLFQELFYGPYFCQVQDPQVLLVHGAHPGRPDDEADAGPREADRDGPRRPDVRGGRARSTGSTTTRPRSSTRTGRYLGKYRKTHIPHVEGLLGEVLLPPGQPGLPGLRDRRRQDRRLHLLRPPLPGGRPRPRPQRRGDRAHPVGHQPRPLRVPLAGRAGQPRAGQRLLRRDDQPGRRRGRDRRRRLLRPELLLRPARPVRRRGRQPPRRGAARPRHGPRDGRARSARPGSSTATGAPRPTAT